LSASTSDCTSRMSSWRWSARRALMRLASDCHTALAPTWIVACRKLTLSPVRVSTGRIPATREPGYCRAAMRKPRRRAHSRSPSLPRAEAATLRNALDPSPAGSCPVSSRTAYTPPHVSTSLGRGPLLALTAARRRSRRREASLPDLVEPRRSSDFECAAPRVNRFALAEDARLASKGDRHAENV
jgi:hypothetical protein